MATKTMVVQMQQRYDSAENWSIKNSVLLAGEIGIESDTGKFKFGDGVTNWKELGYAGTDIASIQALIEQAEDNHYSMEPTGEDLNKSDTELLQTINEPQKGDTATVKRLIVEGKYSYTAYVYNGSAWMAMDGNYSAKNVYFDQDMLLTYKFGKYNPDATTGNVTVPANGKNLYDMLMGAYVDVIDPTITDPNLSLTVSTTSSNASSDLKINGEVGSTYALPTVSATMTSGTYNYGSTTNPKNTSAGITATEMSISSSTINDFSASTENSNSLSKTVSSTELSTRIVTDNDIVHNFSASVSYPASTLQPVNNVGNTKDEDGNTYTAIDAGTDSATAKMTVSGWRKMFMGSVDEYNETTGVKTEATINSSTIRGLTLVSKQVSTSAQTFTVPVGATKVILAFPSSYTISKIEYYTMSWENFDGFKAMSSTVDVADARGGENGLTPYNVYTFTHANPSGFEAATQFRVTLKKV